MKLIHMALNIIIAIVMLMVFFAFGPAVESRFFPVYSRFRLISAEATERGSTMAVFEFTKFRNCDPQGYAFFNGELGQAFYQVTTRVSATPDARARPLGTQQSYPYEFVGITPEELRETVFAEIYSHCHALWLTRTKVYP